MLMPDSDLCSAKSHLRVIRNSLTGALYYPDQHFQTCERLANMRLYTLDPFLDTRWNDLVTSHPKASAFHQTAWLQALAQTYGYRPIVLTSTPPGKPLMNGLVFCEVRSWMTGRRLVSLPFSDHVEPILSEPEEEIQLGAWLREECRQARLRYIEFRPLSGEFQPVGRMKVSQSFWFHSLDLTPSLEQLFRNCHRSCTQRRIRHAERQGLSYLRGRSSDLLQVFYGLMTITRRRHGLLPQPRAWFRNLMECMNPGAEIRIACKNDVPVAAIFTLRYRGAVVYKYGCSDARFHHLAGMPLLFWRLIEESKAEGAEQLDFGRTQPENLGLTRFKDHWGTSRKQIDYFRYAEDERAPLNPENSVARVLCSALPGAVSAKAGELVYRHIG